MWILHFLPDSFIELVVHVIFLSGVVLTLLSILGKPLIRFFFPIAAKFTGLITLVSLLILLFGTYFEGGYGTEMAWRAKVAEVQAKVDKAAAESKEASKKIDTKVITKTKIVHEKGTIVRQYVDREVTKYDSQCVIPEAFVKAHNDSAEAPK